MDITFLLQSLAVLIVVLAILIFFLLKSSKAKKEKVRLVKKEEDLKDFPTLEELRDRLKDKDMNSKSLQKVLESIVEVYGTIEDFEIYVDIIWRMTRHPHATTKTVLGLERELIQKNPNFQEEISKHIKDALDSRGT